MSFPWNNRYATKVQNGIEIIFYIRVVKTNYCVGTAYVLDSDFENSAELVSAIASVVWNLFALGSLQCRLEELLLLSLRERERRQYGQQERRDADHEPQFRL